VSSEQSAVSSQPEEESRRQKAAGRRQRAEGRSSEPKDKLAKWKLGVSSKEIAASPQRVRKGSAFPEDFPA